MRRQKTTHAQSRLEWHSLCVEVLVQFDVDLHVQPTRFFFTFPRVHTSAQQIEQWLRMCSLNFVMASAAFRWCGHHRGRHTALCMNSSMIGTSNADFLREIIVQCVEQSFGVHHKRALGIVAVRIFVADHMWHEIFDGSTGPSLCEYIEISPGH